jgi:hypothetical protein
MRGPALLARRSGSPARGCVALARHSESPPKGTASPRVHLSRGRMGAPPQWPRIFPERLPGFREMPPPSRRSRCISHEVLGGSRPMAEPPAEMPAHHLPEAARPTHHSRRGEPLARCGPSLFPDAARPPRYAAHPSHDAVRLSRDATHLSRDATPPREMLRIHRDVPLVRRREKRARY